MGCGLAGFAVGIFWPGCFSISSASLPRGGTVMFCLLALCGDLGCSMGPTVVGMVSSAFGDKLQAGILMAVLFPLLLVACVVARKRIVKKA
jgi:MFS-type transporter involved in bile tolerance (Atg22 family)